MNIPAASSMAGGVPTMFVSSLHSQALDLAASGLGFTPISATSIGSVNSLQGSPTLLSLPLCQLFHHGYRLSLLCPECCGRVFPPLCHFLYQTYPWCHRVFRPSRWSWWARSFRANLWNWASCSLRTLFKHSCTWILNCSLMVGWSSRPCLKSQSSVWMILAVGWRPFQWIVSCWHHIFPIVGRISYFTSCCWVWLVYDQASRKHAAVTNLTDWSALNVQVFFSLHF